MNTPAPADPPFPTGTVTFLFTDIEGSTTLWEQQPDAMQAALARHDRLLRHAIESSGGCIVNSTGDGVYAAFAAATNALAASVAAQRCLQEGEVGASNPAPRATEARTPLSLRVRMGLHTGVAEFRDGDYFGAVLNHAARIMSAAHGGQVPDGRVAGRGSSPRKLASSRSAHNNGAAFDGSTIMIGWDTSPMSPANRSDIAPAGHITERPLQI